jgi:hypothetical protein
MASCVSKKPNMFKCVVAFALLLTFDNMASKGLRVISWQLTRKVEAGYKPTHTTETLIGYIVCWH